MRKMLALLLVAVMLTMNACMDSDSITESTGNPDKDWVLSPEPDMTLPGEMPEPPEADYTIPPEPTRDLPVESK